MKKYLWMLLSLLIPVYGSAEPSEFSDYGASVDVEPPASSMILSGNTLFMTWSGKKLCSFDLSNPEVPRLLGTVRFPYFAQALHLDAASQKLYVADGRFITVLNVANPLKMTILERHLVNKDPSAGPVDVIRDGNASIVVCRRGKAFRGLSSHIPVALKTNWVRSVTRLIDGTLAYACCDSVICGDKTYSIPFGTPRKVRDFGDGKLFTANGFNGIAVIDRQTGKVYLTDNLNRYSSYGSHVYDVAPGMIDKQVTETGLALKVETVLLAAGEIGVLVADVSNLEQGIVFRSDCRELRWGNVTGIIRGEGSILYVCNNSYGLQVVDITDMNKMKVVGGVSLKDIPEKHQEAKK